ncbi:hypothetical protein FA95DRAFT_1187300 [Auriscalpium vulgare]|uniref:Uncharacterized protein n=1 Tax=Auriscalpium vulgare TaxID=40419 RepID=A0ACB8R3I8_9AGAM|nr:hypothetical protein FA95DRAFT_1187300 [Auriscalpium vulgare]
MAGCSLVVIFGRCAGVERRRWLPEGAKATNRPGRATEPKHKESRQTRQTLCATTMDDGDYQQTPSARISECRIDVWRGSRTMTGQQVPREDGVQHRHASR